MKLEKIFLLTTLLKDATKLAGFKLTSETGDSFTAWNDNIRLQISIKEIEKKDGPKKG